MAHRRRRSQESSSPPALAKIGGPMSVSLRDGLLTALTLMVIALAMVRCLVPVSPHLYWEDDPRQSLRISEAAPPKAGQTAEDALLPQERIGPAGAAGLDAAGMVVAGLALLMHVAAGGRLSLPAIALGFIGMVCASLHLSASVENTFHVGGWMGAVSLGLASVHLATRERQRRWFIAALAALTVPLTIDAVRYVLVDHAMTVETFKATEDQFLAARGWERGSTEHLMYLRRMSFGEPTGAFAFSNILGSVAAALAMMAACLAAGLWFIRREYKHRWLVPGAVALLGVTTMLLTRSKGASVAMMMAIGLVVVMFLLRGRQRWWPVVPWVGGGLLVAAIGIVLLRGAMGPPPDEHGERSILFRWHYWQAAARIATQSPQSMMIGVGPTQWNEDYHWAKNPLNPEEVRSAHSVFVDYISMLGAGGWAWSLLLVAWLIQGSRHAMRRLGETAGRGSSTTERPDSTATAPVPDKTAKAQSSGALTVEPGDLAFTIALLIALFGTDLWIRAMSTGTPERFLIWSVGMMGAFFITSVLVSRDWLPRGFTGLALLAGAATLLVHGQIEMTFFQASSAPLAWIIVAAAAARHTEDENTVPADDGSQRRRAWRLLPGAAMVVAGIAFIATTAAPLARQQSLLADAETALRRSRQSWNHFNEALALLQAAETIGPHNNDCYAWQARLSLEVAVSLHAQLGDIPPDQIRPETLQEIPRQLALALAVHDRAAQRGVESLALRAQLAFLLAQTGRILKSDFHHEQALSIMHELSVRRPYAWQDRVQLAEFLWHRGRKEEATAAYHAAIGLSDAMYLEPTRMMPALERRRIETRIAAKPDSATGNDPAP